MFKARFPGRCASCGSSFVAGVLVKQAAKGYQHVDCTIQLDYELVRELEADAQYEAWCAEEYLRARFAQSDDHDLDGHIYRANPGPCYLCDTGKRGLVFSAPDGGWVHPDIRDGNAFGRYEREQEAAIYMSQVEPWNGEWAPSAPDGF